MLDSLFNKVAGLLPAFGLNTSISVFSLNEGKKLKKKTVTPSVLYGCGYLLLLRKGAQNDVHYNCIVPLYVHSKSKVTENIFNFQERHQNTKTFISYKTFSDRKKKLKPAKNDRIWLVEA